MKQLILLIAGIALSVLQAYAQPVQIDQVDWSTQAPGATTGTTLNGEFWIASGLDQDGSGTFGVNNSVFSFEDVEGSSVCPCSVGDPNPSCGTNDNSLVIGPILALAYCEVSVSFDIGVRGTVKCGAADDQLPVDFVPAQCPSDNGDQWMGTDGLEVKILNSSTGEERVIRICGNFSETNSFSINETFDVGADGTALAVTITGGTNNGGSYDIGNVTIEGIERLNTALNTQIITDHDNNVVCEGINDIIIQTAANPFSQFTWAFPDGSTLTGNLNNGLDKLTLNNIDPSMSGTYRVTVVDDNLCELYDELDVTILASNDAQCLANLSFSQLFPIQCSTDTLPSEDDNGITGTWTPGDVLADFAGQTINFTFTPDDPSVTPDDRLITVNDLSNFEDFASEPAEIPILCNASDTTFDFIEMFQLNYEDYRLEVSGDLDIFSFITNNSTVIVDAFVDEFRAIDIKGLTPRTVGFQIEAYADCGADPIDKSFFITIIDPEDPIIIDTSLCAGDFLEFGNHKIFGDTVIQGAHDCDTMLIANINELRPVTTSRFENLSASCGEAIYYYDKVIDGEFIGFVKAPLTEDPPHGPDYDTIFRETVNGTYTLPFPASNGCDSIQKVLFTIGQSNLEVVTFDLCENQDTVINVGSSIYTFDKENPYRYLSVASCSYIEITATILPALSDTLPHATYCSSEVVPVEVSPGNFMSFDATMQYPFTVELDEGANGCAATFTVDFTFIEPTHGALSRRICPGESFSVGGTTFNQAVVGQEVLLSGAAASGCDSVVAVTVEVIEPETIPVTATICAEDSYQVEGVDFGSANPTGSVSVPSVLGCDSIIYDVSISFFQVADSIIAPRLCPGDEIVLDDYNFTIDVDNLTADLIGTTADGCLQNILVRAEIDAAILTEFSDTICAGEVYNYAGLDRSASGSYDELHLAASGCDSISTLILKVLDPIQPTDDGNLSECTGVPVVHLGTTYNIAGSYSQTLTSSMGCDSIVNFTVSFDPIPTNDIGILNTCPDAPISVHGQDYIVEGSFSDTLTTPDGCDSIVIFEIKFYGEPITNLGALSTCPAVPLDFLGQQYASEGTYSVTLQSATGCDSTVTFDVVFDQVPETDLGQMNTCPAVPLEFLGVTYPDEGSYSVTLQTAEGCDSIVTFEVVFDQVPETDLGQMNTCPAVPLEFLGESYPNEGSYSVTLQTLGGCDSIVTFEVVFDNVPTTDLGIMNTCPAVPVEFNGEFFANEGSHSVTLQTEAGCDSIVTFEVVFDNVPTTDLGEIYTCPAVPLDFLGQSYSNEGDYSVTLQTAQGCDSIVNFQVVFDAVPTTDIGILNTCPEVPLDFLGQTFNREGNHSVTLQTAEGCDSIVTFQLVFEPLDEELVEVTICPGEQYFVFNNAYTESIDVMLTAPGGSVAGCDSMVHLILTVLPEIEVPEVYDICEGTSVTVGSQVFTDNVVDVPVEFTSAAGCDSTALVTVNVLPNYDIDLGDVQLCGTTTFSIGNETLFDEGSHTVTLATADGCDSLVTVNITRVLAYTETLETTLCAGETMLLNGNTLHSSGTYTETFTSTEGCDSIVTVELTVLSEIDTTFLPTEILCDGESFEYNNVSYATAGDYFFDLVSVDGCDSTVVLSIEIYSDVTYDVVAETCANTSYMFEGQAYSSTGRYPVTYQTVNGCDSTIVLDLTVVGTYEDNMGVRQVCTGGSLQIGPHLLTSSDDYSFVFTSKTGCDSLVNVTLQVVDQIEVDLGTVNICEGESYSFGGVSITQSGSYSDMGTSAIGCDSITTINIEVTPTLEIMFNDLIGSCEGGANGSFVIESIPGALPPFSVTGLEGITQIDNLPFTVSGLSEGSYSFDITDANGCSTFGDVVITNERDNALAITSLEIDPTGIYELILEYNGDIESIEWEDIEGLSCYDCPNPSVDIEETTTFRVTVIDTEGCVSSAEITLTVDAIGSVYFPNVINPNSALGNHRFFPQTELSLSAHYDIFVFDRWGNMVYEMLGGPVNDISFGWNGRYSDNRINAGVFVYSVRIYKENGVTQTYKGDITVVE